MKFKVGDRVSIYTNPEQCFPHKALTGRIVVADDFFPGIRVDQKDTWATGSSGLVNFHSKQCRLLKKKQRRRVWMNIDPALLPASINLNLAKDGEHINATICNHPVNGFIEFIEVKKK